MDVKSLQARLDALQVKAAQLGELANNGTISDAQVAELKGIADEALAVKVQLRGLKAAETMSAVAGGVTGDVTDLDGNVIERGSVKGFITPASVKRMAATASAQGAKALVAGGSQVTAVALDPKPVPLGQPRLGLLSLIPTRVRETAKYSHIRQSVGTNNAAVVAPGATKPTSVFTVASVDNELKVYAHLSEYVDKYLLQDNEDLESFLEGQLRDGVFRKVTADAVATFAATSGIQTQAFAGTAADSVYLAASRVGDLGYDPNLIVMSREDYDLVRLSKDAEERYLGGNPFEGGTAPGLWGITTLLSSDIESGTALVLDTSKVGISTDRQGVETVWDAISGFAKNEVRARTEGRFAADVFAPAAIAKVTLTGE